MLQQALDLINQSRTEAGLQPVAWDPAAAQLAQSHAEDMLAGQFFSHWNRDGYGPDHRAALVAGMSDSVFENIHTYWLRFDDGTPAPIEDWPQRILDAQQGFMDSPGHRDNILDPAHTHVGVGVGYRPDTGELRVVQEFVNRYVDLDPLPAELAVGDQATITGRLLANAANPVVNLAYEPFPQPMTAEQLNQTGSYQSAAEFFSAPRTRIDGQGFQAQAIFDANQKPGLYHVRIFVTIDDNEVLAASPIVLVR